MYKALLAATSSYISQILQPGKGRILSLKNDLDHTESVIISEWMLCLGTAKIKGIQKQVNPIVWNFSMKSYEVCLMYQYIPFPFRQDIAAQHPSHFPKNTVPLQGDGGAA